MAREKSFENKVKRWIKDEGGYYVKYHGDAFSTAGVPDLLACIGGRFVGIEVKADDGEPSELQLWTIRQIRKAGGHAVVLFPSAFEEFKAWATGGFVEDKPEVMK